MWKRALSKLSVRKYSVRPPPETTANPSPSAPPPESTPPPSPSSPTSPEPESPREENRLKRLVYLKPEEIFKFPHEGEFDDEEDDSEKEDSEEEQSEEEDSEKEQSEEEEISEFHKKCLEFYERQAENYYYHSDGDQYPIAVGPPKGRSLVVPEEEEDDGGDDGGEDDGEEDGEDDGEEDGEDDGEEDGEEDDGKSG